MRAADGPEDKITTAAKINVRLGMAYLDRHDISRAKQKFLLALDQGPYIPETWYSMGYFMEATGNTEQAQKYYLKAIKVAPDRGDTLNNYGTYLCRNGNYQTSITYFMKAIKDPKYLDPAAAYENAGLCALKIPDHTNAAMYFKRALAEDPTRATSLIKLAELNYRIGNYALARHELKQYLQLSSPTAESYVLEQKIDAKL